MTSAYNRQSQHSKSNIQKIATGQGDDCTTRYLLDYNYFNKRYKMIAIDLSKQQTLDGDPKIIQQINFIGNLGWDEGATVFSLSKKQKRPF